MKKIVSFLVIAMAVVMVLGTVATSAIEPYQTYTYSADGFALYSPAAYSNPTIYDYNHIFSNENEAINFNKPTDIFADDEGNVYIADSGNNRIVIMEGQDYKHTATIDTFRNNGYVDSFNECRGVFVDKNYVYVCDTNNERIVVFDRYGNFDECVKVIGKPSGTLFGATTQYNPVAGAVDQYERIFVISYTTFEGVIVMTKEGVFTGYIGAQKGNYSALELILRRFQSAESREDHFPVFQPVSAAELPLLSFIEYDRIDLPVEHFIRDLLREIQILYDLVIQQFPEFIHQPALLRRDLT